MKTVKSRNQNQKNQAKLNAKIEKDKIMIQVMKLIEKWKRSNWMTMTRRVIKRVQRIKQLQKRRVSQRRKSMNNPSVEIALIDIMHPIESAACGRGAAAALPS